MRNTIRCNGGTTLALLAATHISCLGLTSGCRAPDSRSAAPAVAHTDGDTWSFLVEPYVLFADIEGDVGLGPVSGTEVDVDFGEILESLEMGAMVHGEAWHRSGWGVTLDYAFMDLGKDGSGPLGGVIDAGVRQGVLEALASRRFDLGSGSVDLFGGLRWWDLDLDVDLDPALPPGTASLDKEVDWVDPVLGARWMRPLSGHWTLKLRGDVGGFGLESDFTWAAELGALYHFNDSFALEVQYKALGVDYEEGTPGSPGSFSYDTVTHGPLVGLAFAF